MMTFMLKSTPGDAAALSFKRTRSLPAGETADGFDKPDGTANEVSAPIVRQNVLMYDHTLKFNALYGESIISV
jgi:hypothetical protein